MQSSIRVWLTQDARRAGWISAIATIGSFNFCPLLLRKSHYLPAHYATVVFLWLLAPVSLGCLAVAVLNWRRWHNFSESMAACFLAALSVYKVAGVITLAVLMCSVVLGPIFLYLLAFLIYASLYIAFYVSVSFIIAVLLAWTAGALLYGSLRLMRYAGGLRGSIEDTKVHAPQPLRLVVSLWRYSVIRDKGKRPASQAALS